MTSFRGSVVTQIAGLEILARDSLIAMRHSSVHSSHEEIQEQERGSLADKEWHFRILRAEFLQKNLEDLYRRYDGKLMLGYQYLFLVLLAAISLIHILVVVFVTGVHDTDDIIAVTCYSLKVLLAFPIILFARSERLTRRYKRINIMSSIAVVLVLVVTDACVPIFSAVEPALRPSYITFTLLACYVLLPINNNYLAGALATVASIAQLVILYVVTYKDETSKFLKLGADFVFLLGTNFLGLYYSLMNEVVKRRSFLDRRACIEVTLKFKHEKNEEERLMLSILPEHIATDVKNDVWGIFKNLQSKKESSTRYIPPRNVYIKEYKNVSILYADVVNYTMMTTKLPPMELIETLNELFGRFDEASQEHGVLRIKFLGDCYYCVSGVPKPNPQHAKSCVDLGLDMISIIAKVRERRNLNIDMRIGVHTGDIMCGIIGIRKWQFDIWSKAVTIANKMESTGEAGKVHITNETLVNLGEDAKKFVIERNFKTINEPLLLKNKIETFLVTKVLQAFPRFSLRYRSIKNVIRVSKPDSNSVGPRRRMNCFMDNNKIHYYEMFEAANQQMEKVIEEMPKGITGENAREETINPYTLLYRDCSWERSFIKQPDPLFKYFIGAGLFVFILMMVIQGLTIEALGWKTLAINGSLIALLVVLQPLMWTQFLWRKWRGPVEPKNRFIRFLYNTSASIVLSTVARSFLYLLVSSMLSISSLVSLAECDFELTGNPDNPISLDRNCIAPWHLAQTCTLALMMNFLFSRVFFLLKWVVGLTLTGIYIWLVWDIKSEVFMEGPPWNKKMDVRVSQTLAIVFLTMILHWTDRQTEYRNRLDHRWKKKLILEKNDAYTMMLVNNMLLNNILPTHVAEIYLKTNRSPYELYYEEYRCVAVIFASLTDYELGLEDDDEASDRTLITVLNQLISDFDKLLISENSHQLKVEKIKMAGWTYMAACGLEPGRKVSPSPRPSISHSGPLRSHQISEDDIIITMLNFAADMMKKLESFNRAAFQSFYGTNLKIGISHGEVTAGVVGSSKPLYDIWGNAVNMAARMDSTGVAGKIQVTENTAIALDRQGIRTECRGKIFVKGVGDTTTYFVPLDTDFNLIRKTEGSPAIAQIEYDITKL